MAAPDKPRVLVTAPFRGEGLETLHRIADVVYDPWIDIDEARQEHAISCLAKLPDGGGYDAVVVAVAHREFLQLGERGIRALGRPQATIYDVKSILPMGVADGRL